MSPSAPLRPCAGSPLCPNLVTRGKCPSCQATSGPERRSRHQRGYGNDWERLRAWFVVQPENLFCKLCAAKGLTRTATTVDHIEKFHGLDDPRRLDPKNLRALCDQCHAERHGGRPVWGRQ